MTVLRSGELPVTSEQDVVLARQLVRKLGTELGLSLIDLTKIVTATSELARNTVIYGGGGILLWEIIDKDLAQGLRLTFSDDGPGIENLDLALTDGWTSGKGLGMGLSGSKRLVSEFDIQSEKGKGTKVTIIRWKKL